MPSPMQITQELHQIKVTCPTLALSHHGAAEGPFSLSASFPDRLCPLPAHHGAEPGPGCSVSAVQVVAGCGEGTNALGPLPALPRPARAPSGLVSPAPAALGSLPQPWLCSTKPCWEPSPACCHRSLTLLLPSAGHCPAQPSPCPPLPTSRTSPQPSSPGWAGPRPVPTAGCCRALGTASTAPAPRKAPQLLAQRRLWASPAAPALGPATAQEMEGREAAGALLSCLGHPQHRVPVPRRASPAPQASTRGLAQAQSTSRFLSRMPFAIRPSTTGTIPGQSRPVTVCWAIGKQEGSSQSSPWSFTDHAGVLIHCEAQKSKRSVQEAAPWVYS